MTHPAHEVYPSYSETGNRWLGAIPSHWRERRVKDELKCLDYRRIPLSAEVRGQMQNPQYDYYGASGVIDKVEDYIFDEPTILIGEDGANLLNRGSALAFLAKGKYWVNNHAHILKPRRGSIDYFCYLLESFDYTECISGSAQPKFTLGELQRVPLIAPPIPEQQAIARYLDRKAGGIDRKVELLKKKAQLYRDLKQSLINETVTRGLNKAAPLCNSGVDWIGQIPAHWKLVRIKDIGRESKTRNGNTPVGDMLSVSGYRGIEVKDYDHEHQKRTVEELRDYRVVKPGQLVVNTMWLNYRGLGVSPHVGYVSPAYRVYSINDEIFGAYLHHLMRSDLYVFGYCIYLQGIRPNSLQMKTGDFESFPIVLPPIEEQTKIVSYLEEKTGKLDRIVETLETQIDKLKELRKTLINDVVTGKTRVTQPTTAEAV